jgi:hypothetical protein
MQMLLLLHREDLSVPFNFVFVCRERENRDRETRTQTDRERERRSERQTVGNMRKSLVGSQSQTDRDR